MKPSCPSSFFSPFFWVNTAQFLDTFNNNFFRMALTSFVMFEAASLAANTRSTLAALAVALLMFPTFIVSAVAGELADKYAKNHVIQAICILQFIFVVLGCVAFAKEHLPLLFISLLGLGAGGSMLSPVKYSILPEILPQEKLLLANGLMQAAVYAAILGGTILGGMIFSLPRFWLYLILSVVGVLVAVCSLFLPRLKAANPQVIIDKNILRSTYKNMRFIKENPQIFICILAISWFWGVGTVILSQIPALVAFLQGNNAMFTFFIALFSCGIGIGSLCSQLLLRGRISAKYSPVSLFMATLCLVFLTGLSFHAQEQNFATLTSFLHTSIGVAISVSLLCFAIFGGIYIVPLTTLLQKLAPLANRARIIAANNITNALFMVSGSVICSALLWFRFSIPSILGLLSIANILVVIIFAFIFTRELSHEPQP